MELQVLQGGERGKQGETGGPTYQCPRDDAAKTSSNQNGNRVLVGFCAAEGCQELLAALVCCEVDASAQRIPH